MSTRLIFIIMFSFAIIFWSFNRFLLINSLRDEEQSEIKSVLNSIYDAELSYFKEHNTYSSDSSIFEMLTTEKPALVGVLPDCKNTSAFPVHIFLGPSNSTFEGQARTAMSLEVIKGKCHSLENGFTAFAAQNIDEDQELEMWSINEKNQMVILVDD